MALQHFAFAGRLACAFLVGGVIGSATAVRAQDVPANQIIKALTPVPVTRSMAGPHRPGMSPDDRAFVDSLHGRTRGLTHDEGEQVARIAKDRPKIDLEIYFDFNSAAITPRAKPQLIELGKALHSHEIEGSVIVLCGFTDAKGSAEYNQVLSERRAEAVKRYLVEEFDIPRRDLSIVGYGKRHLKDPDDPFSGANRRVQIVNLESQREGRR